MAGAGKSSLGKELAKHFDFNFIDSDKDINIISYCFGCEYFSTK